MIDVLIMLLFIITIIGCVIYATHQPIEICPYCGGKLKKDKKESTLYTTYYRCRRCHQLSLFSY